jgi:methylthioribulose-1-phosphate dehydratase
MQDFDRLATALAATGRRLYQLGLSPATSSNYSVRLDAGHCAITRSGRDKGLLTADDIMVVTLDGKPVDGGKPSAETALHTQLYRRFAHTGAVLHTHSLACTALTMHRLKGDVLALEGYELLKVFDGIDTHDTRIELPIFPNTQDIDQLARDVDARLDQGFFPAYLIRGHGLYTWADTLDHCFHQIEALEHLLKVELLRHQPGDTP